MNNLTNQLMTLVGYREFEKMYIIVRKSFALLTGIIVVILIEVMAKLLDIAYNDRQILIGIALLIAACYVILNSFYFARFPPGTGNIYLPQENVKKYPKRSDIQQLLSLHKGKVKYYRTYIYRHPKGLWQLEVEVF